MCSTRYLVFCVDDCLVCSVENVAIHKNKHNKKYCAPSWFYLKIEFVVYIEGAFVCVMNEQYNYIIIDTLTTYSKLVADRSGHLDQRALQM